MRRVIITGGAAGLGRIIAQSFSALGYKVAVCDLSIKNLNNLKRELPQVLAFQADVTDERRMEQFFDVIIEKLGGVDVLISNAGSEGPAGLIENLEFSDWRDCLNVNLNGAFISCRWAASHMKKQKSGLILLISSTSGLFGVPNRSPYVTAKWGLIGFMKTLAMELGPDGVRVNAICPGAIQGDRIERVLDMESAVTGLTVAEIRRLYANAVSLRRFVAPEDVANLALFLSSDQAKNITGQAMSVDGHTEKMN